MTNIVDSLISEELEIQPESETEDTTSSSIESSPDSVPGVGLNAAQLVDQARDLQDTDQ